MVKKTKIDCLAMMALLSLFIYAASTVIASLGGGYLMLNGIRRNDIFEIIVGIECFGFGIFLVYLFAYIIN